MRRPIGFDHCTYNKWNRKKVNSKEIREELN
jgi:hypothetical protein